LVNPDHICQIYPGIRIGDGTEGTRLPQEWSILLEQPIERTAARPAVQPEDDLIRGRRIFRGKEPKPELILVVRVVVNGQRS
jgi:hypothetical protein